MNPWLENRAEQPQTSHPGEEEGRENRAAWGHPGLDFNTLQKTRCFYFIVWVPLLPYVHGGCLVWLQSPALIRWEWSSNSKGKWLGFGISYQDLLCPLPSLLPRPWLLSSPLFLQPLCFALSLS